MSELQVNARGRDEAPMAMCPGCGEPLVMSFERPGKEFVCLGCGAWWEFLQPRPAPVTEERSARLAELEALYASGVRRIEP